MRNLRIFFVSIGLLSLFALFWMSCGNGPLSVEKTDASLRIVLRDTGTQLSNRCLSNLIAPKAPVANNQANIDEVRIMVLSLAQWQNESEFCTAWESMNETARLDTANWDATQDFWPNAVTLFQGYTGDKYRFAGEFDLEVGGGTATGTISASPGLNYFLIALREGGVTQSWRDKFFNVVDDSTLCFGCDAPEVLFDTGIDGSVVTTTVDTISGTVSDDTLTRANLIVNGILRQPIAVNNGTFSNPVVLSVGINTIVVEASNADGTRSDAVTIEFQGERADLRATLIWDTDSTDMDLEMENPSGEVCNFLNPETGGMKLDVDDADGFGPENISVNQPASGEYSVRVVNFSASAGFGTTATVYIFRNETLLEIRNHTFSAADVNNTWEASRVTLP